MDNAAWERLDKLKQIAKDDPSYQALHREYLESRDAFLDYSLHLPEEIGNFYLRYVHLIANMTYKQLLIACEEMRFPGEETE